MNVVVASLKGGVGKTTAAVYLARAALEIGRGPVRLVDADRQASAAEWLEEMPVEGITVVEAPSERTVARAMGRGAGFAIVDTPPGDLRIAAAAVRLADAVVVPTRAGGVEYSQAAATLDLVDARIPCGLVITAARLGTRDLETTISWWTSERIPIWGIVPERVGIASGPEGRLHRDGIDAYSSVLKRALRKPRR